MNVERKLSDDQGSTEDLNLQSAARGLLTTVAQKKEFRTIFLLLGTSVLLSFLASALLSAAPLLFSKGIDQFQSQDASQSLAVTLIVSSVIVFGLAKILIEQRWLVYQPAENKLLNSIRETYLGHVLSLPLEFHLNRSIGRLDSIVGQGMAGIQAIANMLFVQLSPLVFEVVLTTTVLLLFVNVEISLAVLASIVVYLVVLVLGTERVSRRLKDALGKTIEAQGAAGDAILNAEGIKALAVESSITETYRSKLSTAHAAFVNFYMSRGLIGLLLVAILIAGFSFAIWIAVSGAVAGELSVGALVLTNTCALQMFRSMENFSFSYRGTRQSIEAVKRYLEIFAHAQEPPQDGLKLSGPIDGIQVRNVGYRYPDGRWATKNVSFELTRGKSTAIIGKSGSGKSTIVRMLMKMLDPTSGQILINGHDLAGINGIDLRRRTSVVPQDAVMFKASLAFNIALTENPDSNLLQEAVEMAELSHLIQSLPEGFKTEIGERGFKLSGGERQRLAIARAIYRGSDLFIFDEATSALDKTTKNEILHLIRDLIPGYCVLLITHDETVSAIADSVVEVGK
ncbi:ABC transporter ATP-binding protein [Nitratireductor aquibiodomus RA22]|uniref:ABC transporter ATP-binding protein n=1 Tax=Nitratireductor aquibiodomus RA22 TaxID=1189611 RepID=I5BSS0_9HYPH|nr:ABC transporter ATP-binding protein [Nitratireductor aquibiodomus]EIM72622.1 ABC transporter ATP-binding protein [Nitratireductor aquibiodomus RA22]